MLLQTAPAAMTNSMRAMVIKQVRASPRDPKSTYHSPPAWVFMYELVNLIWSSGGAHRASPSTRRLVSTPTFCIAVPSFDSSHSSSCDRSTATHSAQTLIVGFLSIGRPWAAQCSVRRHRADHCGGDTAGLGQPVRPHPQTVSQSFAVLELVLIVVLVLVSVFVFVCVCVCVFVSVSFLSQL